MSTIGNHESAKLDKFVSAHFQEKDKKIYEELLEKVPAVQKINANNSVKDTNTLYQEAVLILEQINSGDKSTETMIQFYARLFNLQAKHVEASYEKTPDKYPTVYPHKETCDVVDSGLEV